MENIAFLRSNVQYLLSLRKFCLTKLEALHAIWIYVVRLSATNIGGTD